MELATIAFVAACALVAGFALGSLVSYRAGRNGKTEEIAFAVSLMDDPYRVARRLGIPDSTIESFVSAGQPAMSR